MIIRDCMDASQIYLHKTADVLSKNIGKGTKVWQYSVIMNNAQIGENCNINAHVFVENNVVIGDNTTIKCGVQLWDGINIGKNVFIGPNVTFSNDLYPRSKAYPLSFIKTTIEDFASIGANATITPGIILGKFCLVGAGSVVTKNVPPRALVIGNPGKIVGWVNKDGTRMKQLEFDLFSDDKNQLWRYDGLNLKKLEK